jgi:hypothetical protein
VWGRTAFGLGGLFPSWFRRGPGGGPASSLVTRHSSLLSDLMAFTTPGESPLWYRQDDRRLGHGHENVAVTKEPTLLPGHAVNLHAMPCGGNSEPKRRAPAGAKSRGPYTAEVRATCCPLLTSGACDRQRVAGARMRGIPAGKPCVVVFSNRPRRA